MATVTLTADGSATVTLHDALGRRVAILHDGPLVGEACLSVPLARLAPGVYVVRAVTGESVHSARVVVSR